MHTPSLATFGGFLTKQEDSRPIMNQKHLKMPSSHLEAQQTNSGTPCSLDIAGDFSEESKDSLQDIFGDQQDNYLSQFASGSRYSSFRGGSLQLLAPLPPRKMSIASSISSSGSASKRLDFKSRLKSKLILNYIHVDLDFAEKSEQDGSQRRASSLSVLKLTAENSAEVSYQESLYISPFYQDFDEGVILGEVYTLAYLY